MPRKMSPQSKEHQRQYMLEYRRRMYKEHPELRQAVRIRDAVNFLLKKGYTVIAPEEGEQTNE